jgi:hypothetical protein
MKSVENIMKGIIDYAGIFPPAHLPFDLAFNKYIDYLESEDNWMLSKFVCPFNKLGELVRLLSDNNIFNEDKKLNIAVLGALSFNSEQFDITIKKDLRDLMKFQSLLANRVNICSYEVKIPNQYMDFRDTSDLLDTLNITNELFRNKISNEIQLFFEPDLQKDNWEDILDSLIPCLSVCNQYYLENDDFPKIGFKLRTGGVTSNDFPTSEKVTGAIKRCIDNNVPFKATAGLHHPLRNYDETAKAFAHGFLNVFGAGIFYYYHMFEESFITDIIEEENMNNFKFDDENFYWKKFKVSYDEIAFVRYTFMLSFGSCSFDEPRNDLRKLNLL